MTLSSNLSLFSLTNFQPVSFPVTVVSAILVARAFSSRLVRGIFPLIVGFPPAIVCRSLKPSWKARLCGFFDPEARTNCQQLVLQSVLAFSAVPNTVIKDFLWSQ